MNRIHHALLGLAVLAHCNHGALAQPQLSLPETLNYIGDLLIEEGVASFYRYENCTIGVTPKTLGPERLWNVSRGTQEALQKGSSREPSSYARSDKSFVVNLADAAGATMAIDPLTDDNVVRIRMSNNAAAYMGEDFEYYDEDEPLNANLRNSDAAYSPPSIFMGQASDRSGRLQKALSHAISLCSDFSTSEDPFATDKQATASLEELVEQSIKSSLGQLNKYNHLVAASEMVSLKGGNIDDYHSAFQEYLSSQILLEKQLFDRLREEPSLEAADAYTNKFPTDWRSDFVKVFVTQKVLLFEQENPYYDQYRNAVLFLSQSQQLQDGDHPKRRLNHDQSGRKIKINAMEYAHTGLQEVGFCEFEVSGNFDVKTHKTWRSGFEKRHQVGTFDARINFLPLYIKESFIADRYMAVAFHLGNFHKGISTNYGEVRGVGSFKTERKNNQSGDRVYRDQIENIWLFYPLSTEALDDNKMISEAFQNITKFCRLFADHNPLLYGTNDFVPSYAVGLEE